MADLSVENKSGKNFEVRFVQTHVIRPLRHTVLRPGLPFETTAFEGDDEPNTRHAALYEKDSDVVIGIGTLVERPWKEAPENKAFQLRGMAVADSHRGSGAGKAVLNALESAAREADATLVWCHARKAAVRFYERAGWQIASEEYDIPTVGPHHAMTKILYKTSI